MRLTRTACAFLFVALAAAAAGCSSNNKGKIEGTKWVSVPQTVKGQSLPDGFFKLDFAADKKVTYQVGPMTYTGKYSLGSGDMVTLNFDQDLAGRKQHMQTVKISGNEMVMSDMDGTSAKFRKGS